MMRRTSVHNMASLRWVGWVVSCAVVAWACAEKVDGLLEMEADVEVLSKPYPMGYPSTRPQPNEVIATLRAGQRVPVFEIVDGKDFRAYHVRMADGRTGFVIFNGDTRWIEESESGAD